MYQHQQDYFATGIQAVCWMGGFDTKSIKRYYAKIEREKLLAVFSSQHIVLYALFYILCVGQFPQAEMLTNNWIDVEQYHNKGKKRKQSTMNGQWAWSEIDRTKWKLKN